MAAADEILGISGQMDISDIQASLDKLCDGLNRVGVDTEALSQRMNKALNDVAQSDEDLATKTTKAMQVLKSAMDEATKGIQVVPEMIDTANKRVETIEGTIGKLNEQLANTEKGSEAFGSLTKQIDAQKHSLELAKGDVKDLVESYDGVKNSISQVNGAYQALSAFSVASTSANSVQSATNIAVGATATTAATATSAEAAAHVANAEAATQNAEAENQNVEATKHLTEALQQYISVASGRAEIERMQSESAKELKADMKLYEKTIEDIQNKLGTTDFAKNIEEATKKIEVQKSKIEGYKNAINNLSAADNETGNGANYYNKLIEKAQTNIDALQSKINDWQTEQQRLNADLQQYNALLEAANKIQGGSTIVQSDTISTVKINVEDTSLSELTSKLDESKQKLQDLEAEASKMDGKSLGDKQKEDLQKLQSEIEKTKNNISVLQEAIREKNEETFIGRLRNQISDFGQKISDFGQSIKDKISQPIDELKAKVSGSSIGQRFSEEFAQAKSGLNNFKDGIINVMTANGKLQSEIGKVGEAFKALGIPVTGSLTAIKSVTKALWGMCATPVGAVIAAIALAFKAVHTWMTKSAEGQKVYTKLMAYFGSLAKSITDIVIIFGEYLYKCFTKPNGPLRDFGNNFVKTFKTAVKAAVNLIGGLGTTIKGVLNMDWDTFTAGLKKTWDGIKGAGETVIDVFKTGVSGAIGAVKTAYDAFTNDDLSKKLGAAFNGMLSKAEQAASLAGKIQEAQIAINKNKETQLKLDGKIAEVRNKIYTLQGKEKIAAIEEAKALVKQKYDFQIKQQQQLVELHEKQAKLHTQSLKDIAAERELRMQVLRTQVQQNSEQRMLIRQEEAAKRSLANKSKTDAKKDATQQKQINTAEGKLDDVIYKNAYERAKAWQSLEQEVTDAKIKAMKESEEKVIAERKRELSKEIEQIEERKNAAIKAERDRQKAEFDAQQFVIKAKGGKAETWDDKKHLDSKNIKKITEQYTIIEQKTVESYNNEIYADELKSYREYLKEYGSLYQQKQAIAEEYEEKIAKAQTEGEKLSLQQQKKKALANFDYESISMGIDWKGLMSGVGNMSKEMLKPMLEKLDAYTNTDKFQQADTQTQQKVVELMQEIRTYLGTDQNATWQNLAASITSFNQSVAEYQKAVEKEKAAQAILSQAKNDLKSGKITQEDFDKIKEATDGASQAVVDAKDKMNTFGIKLNSATEAVTNYTSGLTAALNKLGTWKGNEGFSEVQSSVGNIDALKGALDESLSTMGNGVAKTMGATISKGLGNTLGSIGDEVNNMMGSALGSIVGVVAQIPKLILNLASSIKSFVTGILDSFTQLLQFEWLSDLVNSILDSVGNLIDAIFDLPENLFKALESIVVNGVGGLLDNVLGRVGNVLSFGALSSKGPSDWFTNSNAAKVNQRISKLTSSNERLDDSINRLRNTMSKTYGQQAKQAYEEAEKQQQQKNDNLKEIAKQKASYHGSHNSWDYYWKGVVSDKQAAALKRYSSSAGYLSESEVAEISKILGRDFNGDIWSMNEDEINKMLGYDWFVERIRNTGKHYKGRSAYGESVLKAMQDWANSSGLIDELTNNFKENLTQISFDSMKDSFISNLMDMNKSAKDFADDFAGMMQKSVLSFSLDDLIYNEKDDGKDSIKKLYNDWAKAMNDNDGNLTDTIFNSFNERYDKLVEEGIKQRDEWAKITGYTGESSQSQQTATGKAIEAITADQASSLIGIGYAVQIAQEQGNEVRKAIATDVSFLRIYAEQTYNNISEMRDIQYQGLEQLQAINKNTAPIILIREDIASMYKLMKERY